ncbi:MAG TPA: hypothetical protein VH855_18540 [Acetobacteraceae bacterium]
MLLFRLLACQRCVLCLLARQSRFFRLALLPQGVDHLTQSVGFGLCCFGIVATLVELLFALIEFLCPVVQLVGAGGKLAFFRLIRLLLLPQRRSPLPEFVRLCLGGLDFATAPVKLLVSLIEFLRTLRELLLQGRRLLLE